MIRIFIVAMAALTMVGCAQQRMYSWGDYDKQLYASYKDPTKVTELRLELETLIAANEQQKQKMPPGLYAELGTIYLQQGDTNKAIALYTQERNAWAESQGMMNALIQGLERQKKPIEEASK